MTIYYKQKINTFRNNEFRIKNNKKKREEIDEEKLETIPGNREFNRIFSAFFRDALSFDLEKEGNGYALFLFMKA